MNGEYDEVWKSKDWLKFRKLWLIQNPPHFNGCYLCGICGRWVKSEEVTLDHIEPRTKNNIFDSKNIQPAHGICNYRKGSRRWKSKISVHEQEFLRLMDEL